MTIENLLLGPDPSRRFDMKYHGKHNKQRYDAFLLKNVYYYD